MYKLMIDLETRSDADISKTGVYRYADSPFFNILLFACSVDNAPVQVYDLANGEKIPDNILKALADDKVEKHAFNAQFERVCLSVYLNRYYPQYFVSYSIEEDSVGDYLDPKSWRCTMISSAYLGLPLSLAGVGAVLNLEQQKMAEGKALIKYFCVPYEYKDGRPVFHIPSDAPDKWSTFKAYNKRDVETEMAVEQKISRFPVPDFIWDEYRLDQEINDRGIRIDLPFVKNAIAIGDTVKKRLTEKLKNLTGLENPNSVQQMKNWLADNGVNTDSLGKKEVTALLKTVPTHVCEVLKLRQQTSKSSVKKYSAMQTAACLDDRARGMFQFYGANRTGRESGKLIQLQNLPQNHLSDLGDARELVRSGNIEAVDMLYDNIPDTLSQLIRTAFIPRQGMKFIVADFSAIEMRISAWIAGEQWVMDTFAKGGDIYCATAEKMFGVPVVKHGLNGELRQKGKQASLSCSYGGAVNALKAMGAIESGMKEDELQPLVDSWRKANPNIVKFWFAAEKAAKNAIIGKTAVETHGLTFSYESGFLFIKLPSGRRLSYVKPSIGINKYGNESIMYYGIGANKKWEQLETFGGKIVENCVQAIARDILFYSLQTLSHCFIVGHIHDEIIIECSKKVSLDVVCEQMSRTPEWAEGLLLRADGYECEFYKKD